LRTALLEDGRRLLENLLARVPVCEPAPQPGQRVYRDRACQILSVLGPLTLRRDYYHPPGPEGGFPLDDALGLRDGCTPGAARMFSRTLAQLPFVESSQQLQELAGLKVEPSRLQRLAAAVGPSVQEPLLQLPAPNPSPPPQFYVSIDGTGVPMVRPELEGRAGRGPDGQARTREVKLAAFFTQTLTDSEGHPLRDPDSTTYLASFVCSDQFGPLARRAALQRGMAQASQLIYLGDGAAWVWEIARTCFASASGFGQYKPSTMPTIMSWPRPTGRRRICAANWPIPRRRWRNGRKFSRFSPIAATRSGPGCCWRIISRSFRSRARILASQEWWQRLVAAKGKKRLEETAILFMRFNRPVPTELQAHANPKRFAEIEQAEKTSTWCSNWNTGSFPSSPAQLDRPRASIRVACEPKPVGEFSSLHGLR
jgi:hypothetical protein